MSDLSDFQRRVYELEVAALRETIKQLRAGVVAASSLRRAVAGELPVRDDTRDAHYDLEHLKHVLDAAARGEPVPASARRRIDRARW